MSKLRANRLSEQIKKEITFVMSTKVKSYNLGFMTMTDVNMTADYSQAKVYYTIYGDEKEKENVKKSLSKLKGFIKTELSKKIKIRKFPELFFEYDNTYEYAQKIENILSDLSKN